VNKELPFKGFGSINKSPSLIDADPPKRSIFSTNTFNRSDSLNLKWATFFNLEVPSEKRALINIVIDDGTETIRSVLFHENLSSLGLTEFENPSLLSQQKENLLGKEMVF